MIHVAPYHDYEGKEQEEHAKNHPGHEGDDEKHIRPYFLYINSSEDRGQEHDIFLRDKYENHEHGYEYHSKTSRIIQFYSPWSGPCRSFQELFINYARDVVMSYTKSQQERRQQQKRGGDDDNIEVEFHTVSCSAHHWVCLDYTKIILGQKQQQHQHQHQHSQLSLSESSARPVSSSIYPLIIAIKAGSSEYTVLNRDVLMGNAQQGSFDFQANIKYLKDALGILDLERAEQHQQHANNMIDRSSAGTTDTVTLTNTAVFEVQQQFSSSSQVEFSALSNNNNDNVKLIDILGASSHVYKQVRKEDTYLDAALSFTYALENFIFLPQNNRHPHSSLFLTAQQRKTFVEWIDLLYWTLPPTWRGMHTLIQDIRNNMQDIILPDIEKGKENLKKLLIHHLDVVHELNSNYDHQFNYRWSDSCRSSSVGNDNLSQIHSSHHESSLKMKFPDGYSCGFWNLLHILSIGVAERHNAVLGQGGRERATVSHAAQTVLSYIYHFYYGCNRFRSQHEEEGNDEDYSYNYYNLFFDEDLNDINHDKVLSCPRKSSFEIHPPIPTSSKKKSTVKFPAFFDLYVLDNQVISKSKNYYKKEYPSLYHATFSSSYDKSSSYNKMRSYNSNKNQQRQKEHWRQLALWLWETHNHISTKIDTTSTATSSSSQEEQYTENIWPPDSICKECKFSNGWEWDKDSVYEYLKSEYWPSGTQQFR
eukprot:CAMPEP_0178964274 /NCGR_PEP_ID=MMETSP0789-20121207/15571_1 /TAXON_ID=3005 /ORGANISM="Rhizosolenia setigera, Strain CCMP 1694" /LENGTH=703 /DNA_ID=CAMNT_0020649001 /DNA_START=422 /DNA_END=2533 /DNA_ORIENTATION=+